MIGIIHDLCGPPELDRSIPDVPQAAITELNRLLQRIDDSFGLEGGSGSVRSKHHPPGSADHEHKTNLSQVGMIESINILVCRMPA